MKPIFLFWVAVLAGITPCRAQSPLQGPPPLRFDVVEWDFGDIKEDGGEVSHSFGFTNTGSVPIAIDRVVTSCGCTTPEYPKGVIAPGEKGQLTVNFDPKGFIGDFSKSITVASGGGKYREYLTITGHILPRKRSLEEEYPHDMGAGFRVDGTVMAFRTVAQGRSATMALKYVNSSQKDITLGIEPVEGSGMLEVFAPETVCAGCEGVITLTYDLTAKEAYGMMYDVLRVSVDGVPSSKTVYTATTGIDNLAETDLDTAPKLFLDAQFHDFGSVKQRSVPYTFRIVASNGGKETLHIRSVSQRDGFRSTLREGMTVAPGAKLPFEVTLYSDKYPKGALHESITVVVDDPMRPVREIRISAEIK